VFAIGKLTVRGALASPLFALVLAVFGVAIALGPRLIFFGFGDDVRIARDGGFSALRLAGLVFAVAFGVRRERDRALEATLLARPLTPAAIVVGRFVGVLCVALIGLSMLSAVHYGTLTVAFAAGAGSGPAAGLAGALGAAAVEAAVLTALAVVAGIALPRGVAALGVVAAFTLAHAGARLGAVVPAGAAAAAAVVAYVALGAAIAEGREAGG
jgi:hypothetical protein